MLNLLFYRIDFLFSSAQLFCATSMNACVIRVAVSEVKCVSASSVSMYHGVEHSFIGRFGFWSIAVLIKLNTKFYENILSIQHIFNFFFLFKTNTQLHFNFLFPFFDFIVVIPIWSCFESLWNGTFQFLNVKDEEKKYTLQISSNSILSFILTSIIW